MTRPNKDSLDPKALIAESYKIDGITSEDCRTIFLDWALSAPDDGDPKTRIAALLDRHAPAAPDHPMTQVLRDGLAAAPAPSRRGGPRGRRREAGH